MLTLEWSPDGTRVAALTSVAVEQEHSTYLWICNVRDDACMELKISSGESASLTWSPDGERLFSCAHDQSVVRGSRNLRVCLARLRGGLYAYVLGDVTVRRLARLPTGPCTSWSRLYTCARALRRRQSRACLQCMIGTSAAAASAGRRPDDRQWRPGKAHDITTSPDGRWLAVSFGASVKLYALPLVLEGQCHETMRDVEVRLGALASALACTAPHRAQRSHFYHPRAARGDGVGRHPRLTEARV